jgi:hypothetical protein
MWGRAPSLRRACYRSTASFKGFLILNSATRSAEISFYGAVYKEEFMTLRERIGSIEGLRPGPNAASLILAKPKNSLRERNDHGRSALVGPL